MWSVDPNTMAVTMHKGDTGAYWVQLTRGSGDEFAEGDVAIYEVWQGTTQMIHKEFDLNPATPTDICPGDGKFLIAFQNSTTDEWATGTYNVEIRVAINPIRQDGKVVDGDVVRTLIRSTINIQDVLIDI